MLPHASQMATLNLCTNPYCCDVDGVRVLGTSGQPIDDMQRCAVHNPEFFDAHFKNDFYFKELGWDFYYDVFDSVAGGDGYEGACQLQNYTSKTQPKLRT